MVYRCAGGQNRVLFGTGRVALDVKIWNGVCHQGTAFHAADTAEGGDKNMQASLRYHAIRYRVHARCRSPSRSPHQLFYPPAHGTQKRAHCPNARLPFHWFDLPGSVVAIVHASENSLCVSTRHIPLPLSPSLPKRGSDLCCRGCCSGGDGNASSIRSCRGGQLAHHKSVLFPLCGVRRPTNNTDPLQITLTRSRYQRSLWIALHRAVRECRSRDMGMYGI